MTMNIGGVNNRIHIIICLSFFYRNFYMHAFSVVFMSRMVVAGDCYSNDGVNDGRNLARVVAVVSYVTPVIVM